MAWRPLILLCPLTLSCQDLNADVVVRIDPPDSGTKVLMPSALPPITSGRPIRFPTLPTDDAGVQIPDEDGGVPIGAGLCEPCDSRYDCGDENDFCVEAGSTHEIFCGRDCAKGGGCPEGFECVPLRDIPEITQCIPISRSCEGFVDDAGLPTLSQLQKYSLNRINSIRSEHGLAPYSLHSCLNRIALESVEEMVQSGTFRTKFARECASKIPDCECDWREENQAWVDTKTRTWQEAIDSPFDATMDEPESLFNRNLLSTEFRRAGIAVLYNGETLQFSNVFAP